MKFLTAALLSASLLAAAPATAQDITLLPEGQTLVSLSVTERQQVPQDTLFASLRVEHEDKDAKAVQNHINTAMQKALAQAKQVQAVKTSTGHYSVYRYDRSKTEREDIRWRGAQSIELESKDAESLLKLAGTLQETGFIIDNLRYDLSVEKADSVRDNMMESALKRAKEKANRAAKALGKSNVDIARVTVDSAMGYAAPVMRMQAAAPMMKASADMATPTAEAGESEVTLTVSVQAVAK